MCGIFGLVLLENGSLYQLIINGLIQLQNRGYDSAGLCTIYQDKFELYKYASTAEINAIEKLNYITSNNFENSYIGFGHNRWATHGGKTDENAHPHLSNSGNFAIVHNGIIENYKEIKKALLSEGFVFTSQTDTEVIVNLIEFNYNNYNNVYEAIKATIDSLTGTYGLIIQSTFEPNVLYCVRNGSPLLVGQNEDKVIITSEQSGFCDMVPNYITLHNDDICIISRDIEPLGVSIKTKQNYKRKL
jgi:glucosamine--fructose-6-phosphate aminotransferase (isomerizing)